MTGSFILDYFLLVFLAGSGVFQLAAALGGFRGLLYFRNRRRSIALGVVLVITAFAWFFLSEPRNVPDSAHGMNGNEQFGYFFVGIGTALGFTLIATSLRNWYWRGHQSPVPRGLDALRESNYFRTLPDSWKQIWPQRMQGINELRNKPQECDSQGKRYSFLRRWIRSWS